MPTWIYLLSSVVSMPYGCGDALVGLVQPQLITCPKTQEHTGPATPIWDVGQERPGQGQQLKLLAPCRVEGFFIVVFSYRSELPPSARLHGYSMAAPCFIHPDDVGPMLDGVLKLTQCQVPCPRSARSVLGQIGPKPGTTISAIFLGPLTSPSHTKPVLDASKWVCLKIWYIPNYSHLIGTMTINHWV